MIISSIVAVGNNKEIGRDNDLPWHLPADLKYFKATTMNKPVLMGRKSFESIGRPLPGRTNIVVTRNKDFQHSGVEIFHSISDALSWSVDQAYEELFIIGGSNIYEQTRDIWHKLYLTRVDVSIENATAFFPEIDFSDWSLIKEEPHASDDKNPLNYTFYVYDRR